PRRDDDAGHSEPAAYRPARRAANRDELVRRAGRRSGRRHVVEEAVVLVVVEDEYRLGPDIGISGDRVDLAGDEIRAGGWSVIRMLGLITGGDEPGNRRQPVVHGVIF